MTKHPSFGTSERLSTSHTPYNLGFDGTRSENRKVERMQKLKNLVWTVRIIRDTKGQDLVEYALMAGFVAVAAGAIMPSVATSISTIFSQVASVMTGAASQGS
jgi:pilus assembly protein Flp/PilA